MPKRRFFYDTEFMEHGQGQHVRGLEPTIDLISIGIVSEDGDQEFYGCSIEANFSRANEWVRENVLTQLPPILPAALSRNEPSPAPPWYTRKALAAAVLDFLKPEDGPPLELWAYYGAYDHVALCWLFGTMIELPNGMPMYTMDLKQLALSAGNPRIPKQASGAHNALEDAKWNLDAWNYLREISAGGA